MGVMVALADGGLSDLMVRQVAQAIGRHAWPQARGLHRALSVSALVGLCALALLVAPAIQGFLAPATPASLLPSLRFLVLGALAVACLNTLGNAQLGVLEALGRYDLKLAAAVLASAVMIATAQTLGTDHRGFAHGPQTVAVVFVSGAATSAVMAALLARQLLRRQAKTVERIPLSVLIGLVRLGLPVRLASLLTLGLEPVTRAALTRLAGIETVALYEIAYRVVFQLRSVIVAGLQPMVPHLARMGAHSAGHFSSIVVRAAAYGMMVATPLMGLALMCLPTLSIMILGRPEPMVSLFAGLLAMAWLVNIASAPGYFANLVQGNVYANWASQAVMCITNAVLAPWVGRYWGGIGIVAASAAAILLGSLVSLASRPGEAKRFTSQLAAWDWLALLGGAVGVAALSAWWWHGLNGLALIEVEVALVVAYGTLLAMATRRRLPALRRGLQA